jgi:hypothetical protein
MLLHVPTTLLLALATTEIYVSPSGSDSNPGTAAKPVATLEAARKLSAAAKSVTAVRMAPGTYQLEKPLVLSGSSDSGVTWASTGPPGSVHVSGGTAITRWVASSVGDGIVQADVAALSSGVQDRHLYVNGRRARRTRMTEADAVALFRGSSMNKLGFALRGTVTPPWPRGGAGVEFVYPQSTSPWTEPRCAVKHANASFVEMLQPCWANLVHKACGQGTKGPPTMTSASSSSSSASRFRAPPSEKLGAPHTGMGYIENVGVSAAMQPGDWALDGTTAFYALRQGELLSSEGVLDAIMPTLTTLVSVEGGASNITFEGLVFEYTTWEGGGRPDGYVEQQSGCGTVGDNQHNGDCTAEYDYLWAVKLSPGAVAISDSSHVSFVGCELSRLGGAGLDFTRATSSRVDSCVVRDVSANGIQIGQFEDPLGSNGDAHNTVVDTVINRAAAEYSGSVGISVGYTVGTLIEHSDVSNLTYGAISVGWGWSRHACWNCTNAANNTIRYNRVHDYKQTLNDGGGIYMLGPQNGSLVHANWVYDQHTVTSGALYPDEGSAYSTWSSNVISDIGDSKWLHLWTSSIHDVTVEGNFADTPTYLNHGTRCPMINNTVFQPGAPPPAAQAIMDRSGVRAAKRARMPC